MKELNTLLEQYVEVPREVYKDVPVQIEVEIPVEREVEKRVRVEKRIPRTVEVEKIVEVPVERYVDKTISIDKVVEKPVFIEKVVERPVQRIVEKVVEVPVEKIVQVPREIKKDKIIEVATIVEKPIYVEREVNEAQDITYINKNETIRKEIRKSVDVLSTLRREEEEWRRKLEESKLRFKLTEFSTQHVESTIGYEENQRLRERLDFLHEEYNTIVDRRNKEKTEGFRGSVKVTGMGNRRELIDNQNIRTSTHWRKSVGAVNTIGTTVINRPSEFTNSTVIKPAEGRTSTYVTRTEEGVSRRIIRKYDANGNLIEETVDNMNGNWSTNSNVHEIRGNSNNTGVYIDTSKQTGLILPENELVRINQALGQYAEEVIRRDQ